MTDREFIEKLHDYCEKQEEIGDKNVAKINDMSSPLYWQVSGSSGAYWTVRGIIEDYLNGATNA